MSIDSEVVSHLPDDEAADITALQTAIAVYTPLISKPREAVVGRKEATGVIAEDKRRPTRF